MSKLIQDQDDNTKHVIQATGQQRHNRKHVKISFTTELFDQIMKEAIRREWGFSHMVRHLCEASIEGIE